MPLRNFLFPALLGILYINTAAAQKRDCGLNDDRIKSILPDAAMFRQQQTNLISQPYAIKVMTIVFRNNDGSNVAASEADITRQYNHMVDFYAPHNICFIFQGIEYINNTNLNQMDVIADEPALQQFKYSNCLTIFIHDTLWDNSGALNGFAYNIPNNYMSVTRSAMESTTNLSTTPHEMGHCLGLYHTHRRRWDDVNNRYIEERRARTGVCKNCDTEGDLLCGTEADRVLWETDFQNCVYLWNTTDSCGQLLLMTPRNIMTFGDKSCRDHFTNDQGARARTFLLSTPTLTSAVADDDWVFTTTATYISGNFSHGARNTLTVNNGGTLSYIGASKIVFTAQAVTIKPNTTFSYTNAQGFALIAARTPACD